MTQDRLVHGDLTRSVIGCAMTIHNALRPGLDEKLYENALVIELRKSLHSVEQQARYPVCYDGHLIGTVVPDLVVDQSILVDAKVVSAFNDEHFAQMLGYLNITNLKVALLLNFKYRELRWKRMVN